MLVTIRYFAIIREIVGRTQETRDVPPGTTVADLISILEVEAPRLANVRKSAMLMVNQEYVDAGYKLHDGDEFVMIPPVSGGSGSTQSCHFRVTTDVLDPREVEAVVAANDTGAIVTFIGTVRDNARGQVVSGLEYEAYAPAAEKMLARIAHEIESKWGLTRVAIVHRTGLLQVGEASVVISISSKHRDEAFDACRYAIVRLKEIVPIWKKEFYADGAVWIGSEADYQIETGRPPAIAKFSPVG